MKVLFITVKNKQKNQKTGNNTISLDKRMDFEKGSPFIQ